MRILLIVLAVITIWLGYHFLKGLVQGIRGPRFTVLWNDCEEDDLPPNL